MTTAERLLPPVRPSFYDRWQARLTADPELYRRWAWIAPALVTLLAAVLRFWNLGHPHQLVFDETYYVKDAWSQWVLGYSSTWPDGANERFIAGETDFFSSQGSFVVHPPLGKWIIAAGMWVFGPESSFGWRFSVALFGTATVLVLYFVAKLLTGSIAFSAIASGLLAIDGLAIVLSRVAVLDGLLTFFVLLTFLFVLLDRRLYLARFEAAVAARGGPGAWGPVLWDRPWLVAVGLAAGAATAVKWSGLYVVAGLAVYLVVTDALARRHAGVRFWPVDALRQGLASAALAIPAAFTVYLASWLGWLLTDGGYGQDGDPNPFVALWKYHEAIYGFHVGLTNAHGYASAAWQWPLLLRPTSMYYQADSSCADNCVQNIFSMPNPLTWYAGVAAVVYLAWRFIVARDWRYAFVLTGIAVTYVPWLLYPERTIFQFYTVAILPFMLLALTFALRDTAGGQDASRRLSGQRVVLVFLAFVVAVSAFWFPIVTATSVPYEFYIVHRWVPGWV